MALLRWGLIAELLGKLETFFTGSHSKALHEWRDKNGILGPLVGFLGIQVVVAMLRQSLWDVGLQGDNLQQLLSLLKADFAVKVPFALLVVFSLLTYLIVYNRYVSIIHGRVNGRIVRWGLSFSIALMFVTLVFLAVGFGCVKALYCLAASFFIGTVASVVLLSGIERAREQLKGAAGDGALSVGAEAMRGWLLTNVLTTVGLLVFAAILPGEYPWHDSAIPGIAVAQSVLLKFTAYTSALMVAAIVAGGLRGAAFNRPTLYMQDIEKLNEYLSSEQDTPPPMGKQGVREHSKRVGLIIAGLMKSARVGGASAAAMLIWFSTHSITYAALAGVFLLSAFLLNDWADAVGDKLCHPSRPIPSGLLSRRVALFGAVILAALYCAGMALLQPGLLLEAISLLLLSVGYSVLLKPRMPALATPLWSLTVTVLVLLPTAARWPIWLAVACVVLAREISLDFGDRRGDAVSRAAPSLAHLAGARTFDVVAALVIVAAATLEIYVGTSLISIGLFALGVAVVVLPRWRWALADIDRTARVVSMALLLVFPLLPILLDSVR